MRRLSKYEATIERALPFVDSFMKRRGIELRGKEAETLIAYVLSAARAEKLLTEDAYSSESGT